MKKGILSLALALLTCLSLMPMTALAAQEKVYQVGQLGPAGGYIIYVDTADKYPGWKYLEAAPTDLPEKLAWSSEAYKEIALGTTSRELGTGKANTAAILAADANAPAAKACSDYSITVKGVAYDDWFLPSQEELHLIYSNRNPIGNLKLGKEVFYWSSSEDKDYQSVTWDFNENETLSEWGYYDKVNLYFVRPVRAFEKGELETITSEWAKTEIDKAGELGLIPDSLSGADLTKPVTRAEFAAISVKVFENLSGAKAIPAVNNPFTDTKDVEALKAYNVGITTGTSATTFAPNDLLNREQAAAMLTRVFKKVSLAGWTIGTDSQFTLPYTKPAAFADDAKISSWAKDSVYFMAANGIINGTGNNMFSPRATTPAEEAQHFASATREQALAIAVRMVEKLK